MGRIYTKASVTIMLIQYFLSPVKNTNQKLTDAALGFFPGYVGWGGSSNRARGWEEGRGLHQGSGPGLQRLGLADLALGGQTLKLGICTFSLCQINGLLQLTPFCNTTL